jgi:hypothetical protein
MKKVTKRYIIHHGNRHKEKTMCDPSNKDKKECKCKCAGKGKCHTKFNETADKDKTAETPKRTCGTKTPPQPDAPNP